MYCNLGVTTVITTGATSISQALMVNKTLQKLCMANNQISDDGIIAIAGSLINRSITLLVVMHCGISVVGVRSLAVAFQNIKILFLGGNPITVDGARLIMKSAVENGVCEYVWIGDEYKNDKEVKKMTIILDDRRTQNVSNHKLWCII